MTRCRSNSHFVKTSRFAVGQFIARYQQTGSTADAQRSGRKPILDVDDQNFVDEQMAGNNDEFTSSELQKRLLEGRDGMSISSATV